MSKGDREILKADPEDGTTPIANLLLEAIAIAKLTGREKGILLLLCRKTYGWQERRVTAVELWQLVLADLKQQVSAANYRTWLEKSVALGTRDGVFVVGMPPGGAAEYLAQNQRSLIERTLAQYLGGRIKVEFIVRQPDVVSP